MQIRCLFFFPMEVTLQWMAEGSALCPPRSLSISSSPPPHPLMPPPNIVHAYSKCHPPSPHCVLLLCTPTLLFQSTPPCHRVSAAITFSITSQCEVNFPGGHLSEPITAGGQAEVKWHDLWVGWERGGGRVWGCVVGVAAGGNKCMANLWDIWIKAWELWWGAPQFGRSGEEASGLCRG